MAKIIFEKWHGIGNDFVLIDNRKQKILTNQDLIMLLGDRHRGIGFDQLILLDNSKVDSCDSSYRFFNPDGSQAEQCGNGQRCISRYLQQINPKQSSFCVSGLAGLIYSKIMPNNHVKVDMGSVSSIKDITIEHEELYQVEFGNPHLVSLQDDVQRCNLEAMNKRFTSNYTNGINFEIAEIVSTTEIRLRVYERGVGETQACGSGACAAVYALQKAGKLAAKVNVVLPGGNLMVEYNQQTNNIYLTGSATHVFTGEITL